MKQQTRNWILQRASIAAAAAVMGAFILAGLWNKSMGVAGKEPLLPIYSVQTEEKQIALTFDAAWGNSDTDVLIELLDAYGAQATFFVTGDWADRYPEDVRKLFEAGHDIQNHSDTHLHPNNCSRQELTDDTYACDQKIEAITGVFPNLYRAPYGEYNNTVIETLQALGKKVIQWDVDSIDWQESTPQVLYDRVMDKVQPGSILLFHNDTAQTIEALKMILPALKKDGYAMILVNDLIPQQGNFTIDHTGRLCPAA